MHLIRWSRSDITKLSEAVSRYNDIVEQSDVENLKPIKFSELKEEILTRKELKRQLAKLNRLTMDTAETWNQDEFTREIKLAERRLEGKLKNLSPGRWMGNPQYYSVEGELKNIRNFDNLTPSFKKKKALRIAELAREDYDMKTNTGYRDWYIKTIDEYYSNFAGYEKLRAHLKSIKNPTKFYNIIKGHINVSDIYYLRYTLQTQALFNEILEAWGLDEEDEYEWEMDG